ncbi:MAG: bactofilin family protein [Hyphomicrobium sp.]
MVFSRKVDPTPTDAPNLQPRRNDRPAASQLASVPSPEPASESVIGNDLTIEGQTITIRCKGSLRINGTIQADLHSKSLEVGQQALIQGAIAADTVNVHGRVSGAIHGSKVVLHASAEVEGDIHSEYLTIEHGATFDGRSRKVTNPLEIAPQLETVTRVAPPPAPVRIERALGPQPFVVAAAAATVMVSPVVN